jgi:ABC-type phosphate transport system substrate-binding protein
MRRIAKESFRYFLACLAACAITGHLSQALAQTGAPTSIAVVVNKDNPVSNLSIADLRKISLGERQYWRGGLPIQLLMRAPGARERDLVLRVIFQMSESQYKQYWVAKLMRTEAKSAPAEVFSSGMLKEGVAAIPGAIAFIDIEEVRPPLKVLRIDGRLPGEQGYPLR